MVTGCRCRGALTGHRCGALVGYALNFQMEIRIRLGVASCGVAFSNQLSRSSPHKDSHTDVPEFQFRMKAQYIRQRYS